MKVYLTKYRNEADLVFYQEPYRNRADVVVYHSKHRQDKSAKKGVESWYFTGSKTDADIVVYRTYTANESSKVKHIFITENRYAN